jgi:hypothetical protein
LPISRPESGDAVALGGIVQIIVGLLIAALVLGLLWWLITYCEAQFPGFPLVFKVIRIVFVVLVVLVLIGLLLQMAGFPVVQMNPRPAQIAN